MRVAAASEVMTVPALALALVSILVQLNLSISACRSSDYRRVAGSTHLRLGPCRPIA